MVMKPSTSANTAHASRAAVSHAVIFDEPRKLSLRKLTLPDPGPGEVLVDVRWSGISTGTERLLWTGDMPPFPGLGYPLVPGYESVGVVRRAGPDCHLAEGDTVFVPGAQCYGEIRGLFGGTASRLVVPEAHAISSDNEVGMKAVLEEAGNTGMIYFRYKKLNALLKVNEGKRNLDLIGAREKYEEYTVDP